MHKFSGVGVVDARDTKPYDALPPTEVNINYSDALFNCNITLIHSLVLCSSLWKVKVILSSTLLFVLRMDYSHTQRNVHVHDEHSFQV